MHPWEAFVGVAAQSLGLDSVAATLVEMTASKGDSGLATIKEDFKRQESVMNEGQWGIMRF